MLDTYELQEATRALVYPHDVKDREERARLRAEYDKATRELENQWKDWLADEYASDLPQSVTDAIYTKAWDDGHSSGYNQVQYEYQELAEFAQKVRNA